MNRLFFCLFAEGIEQSECRMRDKNNIRFSSVPSSFSLFPFYFFFLLPSDKNTKSMCASLMNISFLRSPPKNISFAPLITNIVCCLRSKLLWTATEIRFFLFFSFDVRLAFEFLLCLFFFHFIFISTMSLKHTARAWTSENMVHVYVRSSCKTLENVFSSLSLTHFLPLFFTSS